MLCGNMESCCKNMTPVTFQGLLNRNSFPYHDDPIQLKMESIIVIGNEVGRNGSQSLDRWQEKRDERFFEKEL